MGFLAEFDAAQPPRAKVGTVIKWLRSAGELGRIDFAGGPFPEHLVVRWNDASVRTLAGGIA